MSQFVSNMSMLTIGSSDKGESQDTIDFSKGSRSKHLVKLSKELQDPAIALEDYEGLDTDARIRAEFHKNKEY